MDIAGKRVTVMGLGLHGGAVGTVAWLHEKGAHILVTDIKTREELAPTMEKLANFSDIEYVLGEHREEDFTATDLVVRNPGVPNNSPYLVAATKAGVPIEMDSSLFFIHCPTKDIIGITGSKGKTTTAKAITAVLSAAGSHVVEVGTDGASPLGKLADVTPESVVVFELSSWRLEALNTHKISPATAVVTSILPDHLNTYDSMEAYEETKKTIIRYQSKDDWALLNQDDPRLRTWKEDIPGKSTWFSVHELDDPSFGISTDDISLIGKHQKRNVLPAIHIAMMRGISRDDIVSSIRSLAPIAHRLEIVGQKNGIRFVNNSTATIPEATITAVQAFSDHPLVLILGGGDKQLQFASLAHELERHTIRGIVWLPGTATPHMRAAIKQVVSVPAYEATTMQEAVEHAILIAQSGDTVLLSPGATSFGLFAHEFDRGDQFRSYVADYIGNN